MKENKKLEGLVLLGSIPVSKATKFLEKFTRDVSRDQERLRISYLQAWKEYIEKYGPHGLPIRDYA